MLGSGGFVGTALSRALCDAGAEVRGYGRGPAALAHADPRVRFTRAEFSDASALAQTVRGQEIVIHLIGSVETANLNPIEDLAMNVEPTLRLLDLCRDSGVKKVVFASSGGAVYGVEQTLPTPESAPTNPVSAHGVHKLMIEKYLELYRHNYGVEYRILRIANIYGPGQSPFKRFGAVAVMLHRALSNRSIEIWGDGAVTRDFVYVGDVCDAFSRVLDYEGPELLMNVGTGMGRAIGQVAQDISRITGAPVVFRGTERAGDVPVSILDASLLERETAWRANVDWARGLEATRAWMAAVLERAS